MGGLLFFFLIGLYIWVASKFVRRARPWWGKVVLVLVFILIPTADAFYGRIRLKQMCEAEGGLKINRVVKGVDGFYAPHIQLYWLLDRGYQYVEYGADEFVRTTRDPAGKRIEQHVARLDSLYAFEISVDRQPGFVFEKLLVKDRHTQEVLGTSTNIAFYGGWAERFLGSIADSGPLRVGQCSDDYPENEINLLIASVLIPTL